MRESSSRFPRAEFDPIANALYVALSDAEVEETRQLSDAVLVDVAADGSLVGVEVLSLAEAIVMCQAGPTHS